MATILNILGLSIALAAFMIIFMQLDYDWNFDKFHKNSNCIYRVEVEHDQGAASILSRPLANAFIQSSPHILAGTLSNPWFGNSSYFTVEKDGIRSGYREQLSRVEEKFTKVFEFDMVEGNADAMDEPNNILIPLSTARKIFGNESSLGKKMGASHSEFIVGGVYRDFPPNTLLRNAVYFPIDKEENINSWGNSNYELYILVDSPENSKNLVDNFKRNFDISSIPEENREFSSIHLRLTSLPEIHYVTDTAYDNTPKASRQTLWVLLTIAVAIVIIACINFTNFSTALAPMRIRNINTQKVVGASSASLRLSLIFEAILVNLCAFLVALLLVYLASMSFLTTLVDADINLSSYTWLIILTAVISIVSGLISGIYPAAYLTSFPPAMVLKGSFGLSPKGRRLRSILISIQYVTSFVLIISMSFMYLQNKYMNSVSLGYDKDQLVVTDINSKLIAQRNVFKKNLKAFSGIEDVTFGENLLSSSNEYMSWGRKYKDTEIGFQCLPVDPSYLKVMGITLTEGRDFREDDKQSVHGKFIFNESARKRYNLELGDDIDGIEVIGFMPDIRYTTFRTSISPMALFVWGTQNWGTTPNFAYVKIKAGSNMVAGMQHVRNTLKKIDSEYPYNVRFYDDIFNSVYEKERKLTLLITVFSVIAIVISIVGVFGLVMFESEYRRREISIRKVLGSSIKEVLLLLNKTYLIIISICFVIACPIAFYIISNWLDNFADKTPVHWWVFLFSGLFILIITVITISWQSWRSATLNPADSLKNE